MAFICRGILWTREGVVLVGLTVDGYCELGRMVGISDGFRVAHAGDDRSRLWA